MSSTMAPAPPPGLFHRDEKGQCEERARVGTGFLFHTRSNEIVSERVGARPGRGVRCGPGLRHPLRPAGRRPERAHEVLAR